MHSFPLKLMHCLLALDLTLLFTGRWHHGTGAELQSLHDDGHECALLAIQSPAQPLGYGPLALPSCPLAGMVVQGQPYIDCILWALGVCGFLMTTSTIDESGNLLMALLMMQLSTAWLEPLKLAGRPSTKSEMVHKTQCTCTHYETGRSSPEPESTNIPCHNIEPRSQWTVEKRRFIDIFCILY